MQSDMDGPEPPEHARFAQYLQALAQASDELELVVLTAVLTDSNVAMAESVVVRHIDNRASELLRDSGYLVWEHGLADAVARHPYLVKRLHERALFRAISLDLPWSETALTASSDWLQRLVSEASASPTALAVLAESGRTRRVRNAAKLKSARLLH